MTFYDAFFPSYDYNPYHQQTSYGRRPQPTRNPYASVHQHPTYVHDPYHRAQKQQPQRHPPRQHQTSRNPYTAFPRQSYYPEDHEEEEEDNEGEDEQYIHPAYSSYRNPQKARNSPIEQPKVPVREADNGVHIPIKRAAPAQPNPNRNQQDTTPKHQAQPKSAKQQARPNDVKKEHPDSDKVAVDRSVLEQKDEDPLIVELPIDQITASIQFSPMSQPGSVEYIWEDEDHDDVIETIIDSPISLKRTTPLSIEASEETKTEEDVVTEFCQEDIERSPSYTSEEVDQWRKELETLSFIGYDDVNVLIPLLREHIGHPEVDIESKHKGLQNVLRRLIVH